MSRSKFSIPSGMARKPSIPQEDQRTAMVAAKVTPTLKEASIHLAISRGWTVSTLIERLLMREVDDPKNTKRRRYFG